MKGLVLLVAVLTLVTFASGVMAQQTPATKPVAPTSAAPEKAKVAKQERFIGKISSVDVSAKTAVVKSPKTEMTFIVGDTTRITRGGKGMALADLKQGMDVAVLYKMEADKAMASAITVALPRSTSESTPRRTVERPAETPTE